MKYIILLLISFNTFAEMKFTRIDTRNDSDQGNFVVDNLEEANKRFNKMIDVRKSWMKCDWKEEKPSSIIDSVSKFFADETCADFSITKKSLDLDRNELTYYCHPLTFSFTCEDITEEVKTKKEKKNKDEADLAELQIKYDEGKKMKLDELIQFLKLKGI